MNYETIKSFILFLLVAISLFLSFILWSYQPDYGLISDKSYQEVNVGGEERTRSHLINPNQIVFHDNQSIYSFSRPLEKNTFYHRLSDWIMYNYKVSDTDGRPTVEEYVEIIFSNKIPAELLNNIFNFEGNVNLPSWSFNRIFIALDKENKTLKMKTLSVDGRKEITATMDQLENYQFIESYFNGYKKTDKYIDFGSRNNPLYIPEDTMELPKRTIVADRIVPDSFENALFPNPSLVTQNRLEAIYTDGQRGMQVLNDGRKLEFTNPIQSSFTQQNMLTLLDDTINHINEHKGWTNDFVLERINPEKNKVSFRLTYEGYPVFDFYDTPKMTEVWRNNELYQYERPLIKLGNTLNTTLMELHSIDVIEQFIWDQNIAKRDIQDITAGYYLTYPDDKHSFILEPAWFILHKDKWLRVTKKEEQPEIYRQG